MRLIEPVYKALANNGQDQQRARELFAANQAQYHPVTRGVIAKVFE